MRKVHPLLLSIMDLSRLWHHIAESSGARSLAGIVSDPEQHFLLEGLDILLYCVAIT
jgi:hypothetical protein